jgi:hypothetical protein
VVPLLQFKDDTLTASLNLPNDTSGAPPDIIATFADDIGPPDPDIRYLSPLETPLKLTSRDFRLRQFRH